MLLLTRLLSRRLNDTNESAVAWLQWLETSFKWETRSLVFVLVGVPFQYIYEPAAKGVVLVAMACIIIMVSWSL